MAAETGGFRRRFKPPFSQDAKRSHYLQAWRFRPRDAKTLFRQEMIPLCYASSCLPLVARQGPSLPVLHLFKRLLVLRNLQTVHPGPSLYSLGVWFCPAQPSTCLYTYLSDLSDLSLTNRHATQPSQLPLPTSSNLAAWPSTGRGSCETHCPTCGVGNYPSFQSCRQ